MFYLFYCEVILKKCVLFLLIYKKIMSFKWVRLPSGCIVPGSCVLNVNFGCCFVNYWVGLFRWTYSEYGPFGKEHRARLVQGLWNWQVWVASPFATSVAYGVIWVQFWLLYLVSSLQYQLNQLKKEKGYPELVQSPQSCLIHVCHNIVWAGLKKYGSDAEELCLNLYYFKKGVSVTW